MNPRKRSVILALALVVLSASGASAANWPQWRGPFMNGSTDETDLPATWSMTENMAWIAPMPGPSSATPVVWEDRVFVSSVDKKTNGLLAMCIDAASGEIIWRRKTGTNARVPRNTLAAPSPVTDGKTAWFLYGTGDLTAFDFDGNRLWSRNIIEDDGPFSLMYGYSSSPLLYRGRLYVPVLQSSKPKGPAKAPLDSYLLAIDATTGEEIWRHVRVTDAVGGAMEGYSTPIPHEWNGRTEILVFGADYITGHNPDTGAELWRWGSYNPKKNTLWMTVPSPVTCGGLICFGAPKHSPLYAIRAGGVGKLGDDYVTWKTENLTPDVSSPLIYQGRLFLLQDDSKVIVCLDPKTGRRIWQGRLGGRTVIRTSLLGADGKLYLMNEAAEVIVLKAGDSFEVLHRIRMDRQISRSSIIAAGGRIFIRTAAKLYCISKQK